MQVTFRQHMHPPICRTRESVVLRLPALLPLCPNTEGRIKRPAFFRFASINSAHYSDHLHCGSAILPLRQVLFRIHPRGAIDDALSRAVSDSPGWFRRHSPSAPHGARRAIAREYSRETDNTYLWQEVLASMPVAPRGAFYRH